MNEPAPKSGPIISTPDSRRKKQQERDDKALYAPPDRNVSRIALGIGLTFALPVTILALYLFG